MVLVSEAKRSQGEVDIAGFINLNAVPLHENVEHRHGVSQTAFEILPFAMHNLLEMANQG